MKISEALKEARALIEDPQHWTQGTHARDRDGNATHAWESRAESFCSLGACQRVVELEYDRYNAMKDRLRDALLAIDPYADGIAGYNDGTSHENVLALFDKAIEIAEEREL